MSLVDLECWAALLDGLTDDFGAPVVSDGELGVGCWRNASPKTSFLSFLLTVVAPQLAACLPDKVGRKVNSPLGGGGWT